MPPAPLPLIDCPLVVDLDGTLILTDLLQESALSMLKADPMKVLQLPVWLLRGKAQLKSGIAAAAELDVKRLPYSAQILDLIKAEKASGRKVVLATASNERYARQVAEHLNLFDEVLASDDMRNLSASRKRDTLVEHFGERGFDYVGNSSDDLVVWRSARQAYVANASASVRKAAQDQGNVAAVISASDNDSSLIAGQVKIWLRALRLHQWMKNLLIFVPLLASHRFLEPDLLLRGFLAFLCFGLCASGVYLLNDLLDLNDDRHHPIKRDRPFASGRISISKGLVAFPICLVTAFGLSTLFLPESFTTSLTIYLLITSAYSFVLKRWMIVDVITLALLYTVRIIAGTFAFEAPPTFWIMAFSMFIFLSLALIKRYAELYVSRETGKTQKTRGRDYFPADLELIASMGTSSGYLSVLVLALYIQDPTTVALYRNHQLIWLACPLLLFWISRAWLLAHRGHMNEDPVVFAVKDRVSLLIGGLFGFIFWLAT